MISERAAREWFGYGSWTAPYWFVGMEPGGEGDGASHESWERLGGGELIDCRAHHLDCNYTRWHGAERPPTQPTWRRLIQLLLAYKGEPTDLDSVAGYQRERLGAVGDETAIIELSAHHAVSMDVQVDRTAHRDDRIRLIRSRLDDYAPQFVVFYGTSYGTEYEQIVGAPFGPNASVWRDKTLCVLTVHPVAPAAPPPVYWVALGQAMRTAVAGGPGTPVAAVNSGRRIRAAAPIPPSVTTVDGEAKEIPIMRHGSEAGRIVREGEVRSRRGALGRWVLSDAGVLRAVRALDVPAQGA